MSGWRGPTEQKPFPSLGWGVLQWTHENLPSPRDDSQPFLFTTEQARKVIRWYELDPVTGEFIHLELIDEEAKGSGKSPFAAVLDITELIGPVCFDGWDERGEPKGVPWGTGGRPMPWVQVGAVSEDQADNTYSVVYSLLTARDGAIARDLNVDVGVTGTFVRGKAKQRIQPVTASAGSREGQPITYATLDETHLWTRRNGGIRLAGTMRRNVAKMGGRIHQTTNAPVTGGQSVAEQSDPDRPASRHLHFARRARREPDPRWSDDELLDELGYVYDDRPWANPTRLVAEIRKPSTDWGDVTRFWFNIRTPGAGRAVDPRLWEAQKRLHGRPPAGTRVGGGFDGSISQDATVIRGCTAEGYGFIWEAWEKPVGDELVRWLAEHPDKESWEVDRRAVIQSWDEFMATYDVGLMWCDTPKWRTEIEGQADKHHRLVDGKRVEVVIGFDTNQESRFAKEVDRWLTGLRSGEHTHDGDELTTRHVLAAHKRRAGKATDESDDGRTLYVLIRGEDHARIDAAVTDVLAFGAAMTMPEPDETSVYETRGFRILGGDALSCPDCFADTVVKRSADEPEGWRCERFQGGCGQIFDLIDQRITEQLEEPDASTPARAPRERG